MLYTVLVSATSKLFVHFLPAANYRLLLTEVFMGGSFQKQVHKCLWETDVKYTRSRDPAEILACLHHKGAERGPSTLLIILEYLRVLPNDLRRMNYLLPVPTIPGACWALVAQGADGGWGLSCLQVW